MPQVPADKHFFTLQGGLHTESSAINKPDETTIDEENFELLIDGSRKRRNGLKLETGGVQLSLPSTLGTSYVVNSFVWKNVASDPSRTFIVLQTGCDLQFFESGTTVSTGLETEVISVLAFKVSGRTDAEICQHPLAFSSGRGRLIVTGKYVEPFYVEYNTTTSNFTIKQLPVSERDFVGIEDGIANRAHPTTITDAHTYNLRLRGWKNADITTYNTNESEYPNKVQIPWLGYARQVDDVTYISEDGVKAFNSGKLAAEVFGTSSAPKGAYLLEPWDTTIVSGEGDAGFLGIENWTVASEVSDPWTVTVTVTGHPLVNGDEISISGNLFRYTQFITFEGIPAGTYSAVGSIDGKYTVANAGVNDFEISVNRPFEFLIFEDQYLEYGYIADDPVLYPTDYIFKTDERPQVCAWFAGRTWFMGIDDPKLSDRIYFSQIVESEEQFGRCYQQADPSDPQINSLVATDGGVIVVPDLGSVKGTEVWNDSLLIFTDTGVWQVGGGDRGFFTADGYSVRKVSDSNCTSFFSVVRVDDQVMWTGDNGINVIFIDPQSGQLAVRSLTETTIQALWNDIPGAQQAKVKAAYDNARKRVYFLYSGDATSDTSEYDSTLVFDTRLGAFYKLTFPTSTTSYATHIFIVRNPDEAENNKKVKFAVQTNTRTKLDICDMDHAGEYDDFDGTEQVPFIETAYDNIQDFARSKQAPVLHVFCNRTETGYNEVDGDLVPINESSLLMQARWNWADHENSGKFATEYQVYRHKRLYNPVDSSDTFNNGFPVVVTRNKLRGRGDALHLKFTGEAGKDAHLLGFSIHYRIDRRV